MSPRTHEESVPAFLSQSRDGSLANFGLKKDYCMKNKLQGRNGLDEPQRVYVTGKLSRSWTCWEVVGSLRGGT